MPIRVRCECGSRLDAPDELAGRKAVCGGCGRVLEIVASDSPDPSDEDLIPPSKSARGVARLPRPVNAPKKRVYKKLAAGSDDEGAKTRRRKKQPREPRTLEGPPKRREPTLTGVWVNGVSFPFHREALITIIVLAFIYGPVVGGLSAAPEVALAGAMGPKTMAAMLLVSLGVVGYFCYFLFQTLRAAAANDDDLPVATAFDMEEIFIDLWLMLGGTAVVYSPLWLLRSFAWFTETNVPAGLLWSLWGVLTFLWPMGVTSSALHMSVLAANHWTVSRTILKIPVQYVSTLLVAFGLFAIAYGISVLMTEFLPDVWYVRWTTGIVSWYMNFTVVTACMYLAGNLYYRNRQRIGWFGELRERF
jgi:hypothetical protein